MSKPRQKTADELVLFCSQILLALRSGVFLGDGLLLCGDKADAVLTAASESVRGGASFAEALRDTGAFPDYFINLTDIGERAGKLEDVMESLCAYYEREQAVRRRIKSALFYPLILSVVMLCVMAVLFFFVLPIFGDVYRQISGGATGVAGALISAGGVCGWVCVGLTALFLAVGGGVYALSRSPEGYETLMASLAPIMKKTGAKLSAGRFSFAMALLLGSGCDVDEAVSLMPGILTDKQAMTKLNECREAMAKGASFSAAVNAVGIFDAMHGKLISMGDKTGALEAVFKKLSAIYDGETEEAVDGALGAVEPVVVAVLSTAIGGVLLSVMLPLMSIMTSM